MRLHASIPLTRAICKTGNIATHSVPTFLRPDLLEVLAPLGVVPAVYSRQRKRGIGKRITEGAIDSRNGEADGRPVVLEPPAGGAAAWSARGAAVSILTDRLSEPLQQLIMLCVRADPEPVDLIPPP